MAAAFLLFAGCAEPSPAATVEVLALLDCGRNSNAAIRETLSNEEAFKAFWDTTCAPDRPALDFTHQQVVAYSRGTDDTDYKTTFVGVAANGTWMDIRFDHTRRGAFGPCISGAMSQASPVFLLVVPANQLEPNWLVREVPETCAR